jgi:hypothetical protein
VASAASAVNNLGWGLLIVVFPLWAAGDLGASRSASGAIWSAFAAGSLFAHSRYARVQARHPQSGCCSSGWS